MTERGGAGLWLPEHLSTQFAPLGARTRSAVDIDVLNRLDDLVAENRRIHETECFNLDPASNVMNPRAERLLASGLGSRPSLGYPGEKYETGLEAIEQIEVMCATLCAEVFGARYAEVRVPSGALANLYAFMSTCKPGDTIIAPPASIGGHVTHHAAGCAGLYGLRVVDAPVDATGYSVDCDALGELARRESPALITIGGSLNLFEHPVQQIRRIADDAGCPVLFDAAHQCGLIAGRAWKNPLDHGAHLMTMSTYKSLGGPPGGLVLTNDTNIAQRLDKIAFPGMTANSDAGRVAALAVTMLDWREFGRAYSTAMVSMAAALATALQERGIELFEQRGYATRSHQFAVLAAPFGGGNAASQRLRHAGFLACGIGLPVAGVAGDTNGLRLGTPELVRWGLRDEHAGQLAHYVADALRSDNPSSLRRQVADWRKTFNEVHYVHN